MIYNDLSAPIQMIFNPNGQTEADGHVVGSWELLNGTLSFDDGENAYQCEKYSMADMLYEWAANYIPK